MPMYVALLRGVTPSNPRMRNEKLRSVCDALGLGHVQTVLSSGNVVFETDTTDAGELEATLELAWREQLGFDSTTIIRSQQELQDLDGLQPFGELEHGPETYLLVTFSKAALTVDFELPHQPPARDYRIVGASARELFQHHRHDQLDAGCHGLARAPLRQADIVPDVAHGHPNPPEDEPVRC